MDYSYFVATKTSEKKNDHLVYNVFPCFPHNNTPNRHTMYSPPVREKCGYIFHLFSIIIQWVSLLAIVVALLSILIWFFYFVISSFVGEICIAQAPNHYDFTLTLRASALHTHTHTSVDDIIIVPIDGAIFPFRCMCKLRVLAAISSVFDFVSLCDWTVCKSKREFSYDSFSRSKSSGLGTGGAESFSFDARCSDPHALCVIHKRESARRAWATTTTMTMERASYVVWWVCQ